MNNMNMVSGKMPQAGTPRQERILILTTVSGFLGKFEKENVKLLQGMGWEVHYAANPDNPVYLDGTSGFKKEGIIFHPTAIAKSPFALIKNFRAYRQLKKIIKKENISAIHCHTPVGGLLGRLVGKKFSLKVIYTAHGFHFYKGASALNNLIYGRTEKWLAKYTDALVVINEEDYEAARSFKLKDGGRVYKIPGVGLDTEKFSPPAPEERIKERAALDVKEDEFLLVSVGELNKNKNHETAVAAAGALIKKEDLKIKYIICGEGPRRARLEEKIIDMNLAQEILLPGYNNSVRKILCAADAFVFPSVREGLGMAALEALAAGIPVIAADNRGSREYMEDAVNGFICYKNNPKEYSENIKKLMKLSARELSEMKADCRKTASGFSKEKTKEVMKKVYEDILA